MEGFLTATFILICFGHNVVWAKNENVYFVVGKRLELRPPVSATPITSVLWRHNGNLAAEWANDGTLDLYRNFKGRTNLNTITGSLTVSNMTEELAGVYSVEINYNRLEVHYVVKPIEDLSTATQPEIWVRPGDAGWRSPKLNCVGNVEQAQHVTYWWNTAEDRSWVQLEKIIVINNQTMRRMETFSCKMVNPVSERESEPVPNPFCSTLL